MLDAEGAGIDSQIQSWIPKCVIDKEIDIDVLTSEELRTILNFVRGDDIEGACPLD